MEQQERGRTWPQFVAVLSATIAAFAAGANFAWPSPTVPKIITEEYHINVTQEEASYIPVIGPLGNLVGAPLTAFLAATYGRKPTVLLTAVPQLIAWVLIAFADELWHLYAARLIAGLSEGAVFIVIPMYIGEVSEPKIRGVLGSSISVSFICGILFIDCIGPYFSIPFSAFICMSFPILLLVIFCWMPETPYYHIMTKNTDRARKSLQYLRRKKDVEKELSKLIIDVDRQLSEPGTFKDLFTIKSNLKALGIMVGARTVQQLSGVSAFGLNTHLIFLQAGGDISANMSVIVYTVTQILMTLGGSFFIDKFGRKPILLWSCIGSTFFLGIEAIFFFLKEKSDIDLSNVSWVPLVGMMSYVCVFSVGLGTVPNLLLGELYSASVKGKALFVMNMYYALLISTVSKFYQLMADNVGMFLPFTVFAGFCFLGSLFSHFCVPETKGKTLEEIQQHLKGNVHNKNDTN